MRRRSAVDELDTSGVSARSKTAPVEFVEEGSSKQVRGAGSWKKFPG
jgi:hypothetical protein